MAGGGPDASCRCRVAETVTSTRAKVTEVYWCFKSELEGQAGTDGVTLVANRLLGAADGVIVVLQVHVVVGNTRGDLVVDGIFQTAAQRVTEVRVRLALGLRSRCHVQLTHDDTAIVIGQEPVDRVTGARSDDRHEA